MTTVYRLEAIPGLGSADQPTASSPTADSYPDPAGQPWAEDATVTTTNAASEVLDGQAPVEVPQTDPKSPAEHPPFENEPDALAQAVLDVLAHTERVVHDRARGALSLRNETEAEIAAAKDHLSTVRGKIAELEANRDNTAELAASYGEVIGSIDALRMQAAGLYNDLESLREKRAELEADLHTSTETRQNLNAVVLNEPCPCVDCAHQREENPESQQATTHKHGQIIRDNYRGLSAKHQALQAEHVRLSARAEAGKLQLVGASGDAVAEYGKIAEQASTQRISELAGTERERDAAKARLNAWREAVDMRLENLRAETEQHIAELMSQIDENEQARLGIHQQVEQLARQTNPANATELAKFDAAYTEFSQATEAAIRALDKSIASYGLLRERHKRLREPQHQGAEQPESQAEPVEHGEETGSANPEAPSQTKLGGMPPREGGVLSHLLGIRKG